jgi:ubiquinone/menaquinone biosynthesis C-methylase UbiE
LLIAANPRELDELGALDPLWAIASNPQRRFGRWELEEFFASGRREADVLMARLDELGVPARRAAALDFGCGVGRVTRALAGHFEQAVGLDISDPMLTRGRELNADVANLEFVLNSAADLQVVGERRFDLVHTRIVLQHVAGRDLARAYIEEFLRVLAPGGVTAFQIPVFVPRRYRFMPVRRAYLVGRKLGLSPELLYNRLRLHPIRMQWVKEPVIASWIAEAGGRLLAVDHAASHTGVRHATFYAVR